MLVVLQAAVDLTGYGEKRVGKIICTRVNTDLHEPSGVHLTLIL